MPERAELETAVQQILEAWNPSSFLVDLCWNAARRELRLLVDTDAGIRLHECTALHYRLREELTSRGLLDEDCSLEVGSPGVGKPLRHERQYPQNVGRNLELELQDGSRLNARLLAYANQTLTLEPLRTEAGSPKDGTENAGALTLRLDQIKRTLVIPSFN
jgi:ribosome maturation factor RimP